MNVSNTNLWATSTMFSVKEVHQVSQSNEQAKTGKTGPSEERLIDNYNLRSITAQERIEFANKAYSEGVLTLKEAGVILPINLQKVDTGSRVEIREAPKTEMKYDVIQELENSIAFQKQYGDTKGIEIKESTLEKLIHLQESKRISVTA